MSSNAAPLIDARLVELLASRLCHDLVGPIGAVNNGMELLEEAELAAGDDALALVGRSARQTADLLQFYRMAYGTAGSRAGLDPEELFALSRAFLAHSKVRLDWPERSASADLPGGVGKLLLNLVALGQEGLPRGGDIRVLVRRDEARIGLDLLATGTDAGFRPEIMLGLEDGVSVGDLSPRSVQAYFTGLLAAHLGAALAVERPAAGALRIFVELSV